MIPVVIISHHAYSFPPVHWISVRSVSSFLLADLPPSGDGPLSRGVTDASDLKGLLPSVRSSVQTERQEEEESLLGFWRAV